MPVPAKPPSSASREISTGTLLAALVPHPDKPLVFNYNGRDVLAGYHVTEVKTGRFDALDCGANPETWQETFIQLWDIPPEPGRSFMPVGKFLAIMGKVSQHVPFDPDAKLTFELSDGEAAMQLLRASGIDVARDAVRVVLTNRPASCKPRDRWLETTAPSVSCCSAQPAAQQCCS